MKDPSKNSGDIVHIFTMINNELTEIMNSICVSVSKTDASINKAKGLLIKHMIRADIPNNDKDSQDGFFMNFFNEVLLDLDKMDLK